MKKLLWLGVFVVCCLASVPVFALSGTSSKALQAFGRYEPDFSSSLKKMQELVRKGKNQDLQPASEGFERLKGEAENILDYVQRRYDLMDDLYKSVSGDYPEDRAQLFDAFQRLDDLYRECRDYYMKEFQERLGLTEEEKPAKAQVKTPAKAAPAKTAPVKVTPVAPVTAPAPAQPAVLEPPSTPPAAALAGEPQVALPAMPTLDLTKATEDKEHFKAKVSGTLKFDWRNRNEKYPAQGTALPNNLAQTKLSLMYPFDEKNKLYFDDKYLQRRRNELVKENVLTLSLVHNHSKVSIFTLKDTLHHVWYPANAQKNYRDNLAEAFWNKKEGKYEHLYNLGYDSRVYPDYSKSDFGQLNWHAEHTYFVPNGTLYYENTYNWRSYKNSSNLDYSNDNYYGEFNRSYSGNKSEISLSDTYDRRGYGNEAANLYRTSYWDNFFRFRYDLPVSKTFTWLFEDEYQKRFYASDFARGYAQVKLKTTAKITVDKKTRGRFSNTDTFNDENTQARAHKNHEFYWMVERKYNDRFKLKLEDTFHRRHSLIGDVMDFMENQMAAKATWKLPSKIELTWKNEYLARYYNALYFRDYRYYVTGLTATYAYPKKFDWEFTQDYRSFSNRNGNNISTDWATQGQPLSLGKLNIQLMDDLKLRFLISREKTYYKQFDTLSQELLWDFTRPLTITEFYGGLEYDF